MLFRTREKLNSTLTHIKNIFAGRLRLPATKKKVNFVTQVHMCTADTELSLTD